VDGGRIDRKLLRQRPTGQSLARVYFEDEANVDKAAKRDDARRIAANIARLPELLRNNK
jgi:hypothetical protein